MRRSPVDQGAHVALERLPSLMRERYLRDCAAWQTIYAHHRAIVRLLAEVRA